MDPRFLVLGTGWGVVSFTPLPLYPRGRSHRYSLGPRAGLDDMQM
jgi:hypothetical protein